MTGPEFLVGWTPDYGGGYLDGGTPRPSGVWVHTGTLCVSGLTDHRDRGRFYEVSEVFVGVGFGDSSSVHCDCK